MSGLLRSEGIGRAMILYRSILKELRQAERLKGDDEFMSWRTSPVYPYLAQCMRTTRELSETDIQTLSSYRTVLSSSRRSQELQEKYKGVGERSIEESAKLVGLNLPKLYKDSSE